MARFRREGLILGVLALSALGGTPLARRARADTLGTAAVDTRSLPLRVMDVDGGTHELAGTQGLRVTVLVFLATGCPICNEYVPALRDLAARWRAQGVAFYGVLSDPTLTREEARVYEKQYSFGFPLIFDGSGLLEGALAPRATPEAFVLDGGSRVLYSGRIDDAFSDAGKENAVTKHTELADALASVASSSAAVPASTEPFGCLVEPRGAAPVTFARDVAPILDMNCVACHRTGGNAPFALDSFREAKRKAHTLARIVGQRTMPPWHAAPDFGHVADVRRLTDGEIALIQRWAESGAEEGKAQDLPPVPSMGGWMLGEPDMVIEMPLAFDVPERGRDIYRGFVIAKDFPRDEMVAAVEVQPGAATVVHHVLVYLDRSKEAQKLEALSGGVGYDSDAGGPGFSPSGMLGGWAVGATPWFLPSGMGAPLAKGSDIVLEVHYHASGKVEHDKTRIGIFFARKDVAKVVGPLALWNQDIDIPAGDASYRRTVSVTLPRDVEVVGAMPHMHKLGRQMKVIATKPSGEVVPLIWVPAWDFNWQEQYHYVEPIPLPRGTRIELEAIYDNSKANPNNPNDPPQRVTYGPQTTDEMCLCFLSVACDSLKDLRAVARASGQ